MIRPLSEFQRAISCAASIRSWREYRLFVREKLAPFYSEVGRPSIDPELMIRMLIVGYCYGIRFERRLWPRFRPVRGSHVIWTKLPGPVPSHC
jgi:hypothetical protein